MTAPGGNRIDFKPENSGSAKYPCPVYYVQTARELTGTLILMENRTGGKSGWTEVGVIPCKHLGPTPVAVTPDLPVRDNVHYCVKMEGDDDYTYYSEAYRYQWGEFYKAPYATVPNRRVKGRKSEVVKSDDQGGYFRRHRTAIVTFVSLGTTALILTLYLFGRH